MILIVLAMATVCAAGCVASWYRFLDRSIQEKKWEKRETEETTGTLDRSLLEISTGRSWFHDLAGITDLAVYRYSAGGKEYEYFMECLYFGRKGLTKLPKQVAVIYDRADPAAAILKEEGRTKKYLGTAILFTAAAAVLILLTVRMF